MDADLEQIKKPLSMIIKAQIDSPSGETEMYFDNIHLSPLKVWNDSFFVFVFNKKEVFL